MISVGSYWFLVGTNIEVGIKNVSADGKLAMCTFRNGKREGTRLSKQMKKQRSIMLLTEQVPVECLAPETALTKRSKIKKDFQPRLPLDSEIPSAIVEFPSGRMYIWGLKQMGYNVKSFDKSTGVVTFAVRPVRKAHISVVRFNCTQTPQPWSARLSPINDHTPVEFGYIPGTTISVQVLIEDPTVSLYKISNTQSMWIQNDKLGHECCEGKLAPQEMTSIGIVYLHGFIPVIAFETEESLFVNIDGVFCTVNKDVVKDKDPELAYLLDHRNQETRAYLAEHRNRREQTHKLLPLAVF